MATTAHRRLNLIVSSVHALSYNRCLRCMTAANSGEPDRWRSTETSFSSRFCGSRESSAALTKCQTAVPGLCSAFTASDTEGRAVRTSCIGASHANAVVYEYYI